VLERSFEVRVFFREPEERDSFGRERFAVVRTRDSKDASAVNSDTKVASKAVFDSKVAKPSSVSGPLVNREFSITNPVTM